MAGTAPPVKSPRSESKPRSRGLPPEAYDAIPGDEYTPYVPASQSHPRALVFVGTVIARAGAALLGVADVAGR